MNQNNRQIARDVEEHLKAMEETALRIIEAQKKLRAALFNASLRGHDYSLASKAAFRQVAVRLQAELLVQEGLGEDIIKKSVELE